MSLDVGKQVGDYRILSRIGKGAYGIVFEAEHVHTKQNCALKVIPDTAGLAEDEERLLREIRAQAALQHPNIAEVYQVFRDPSGVVVAMERVEGESLRSVLDRQRLPLATGLRYILETLGGLEFAGRSGVIHRNLKPENILITRDARVKITDFGLGQAVNCARITGSGASLGMPWYIAPEQVDGKGSVDARTDIYSTGAMLYEIATGQPPFPGSNAFAVACAHLEKEPTPPMQLEPGIGDRLNAVILQALAKAPSRRYPDAAAFRAAILQAAPAQAATRAARAGQRGGFPWLPVTAVAIVGLAICGAFMAGGYWQQSRPGGAAAQATPAEVEAVPGTAKGSPNAQASTKRAPKGSPGRAARPKSPSTSFANVEGRYVIGQQGETGTPAPASVQAPAASPAPVATASTAAAGAAVPPAAKPEEPATEPKKHNVLARTIGKIFHKKDKHTENAADRKEKDPKPPEPNVNDRPAGTKTPW